MTHAFPTGHPTRLATSNQEIDDYSYRSQLKYQVINDFKRLYPMPHVMLKARKIIDNPNTDFSQLADVVNADSALAGRILKVANSAYYQRCGTVSTMSQALATLGTKVIVQIIDLVSQSKMLGRNLQGYGMDSGELWRHALTVAVGCRLMAEKTGAIDGSEAFLAGLMHDAGKIILNQYIQERSDLNPKIAAAMAYDAVRTENAILGFDHAEIGCELCIRWQLPVTITNAIRLHHLHLHTVNNPLVYILQVADQTAHHLDEIIDGDAAGLRSIQYDKVVTGPTDTISRWAKEIKSRVEDLEDCTM